MTADVCQDGTLFRLVQLFAFDDTARRPSVNGNDVLLGGDGDDWMHGGAGQDLMQGDGDGAGFTTGPLPGVEYIVDPNDDSADVDRMFGGDSNGAGTVDPVLGGNGDAIWGGRGNDHTYGGRGDDMLDVHPDPLFPTTWDGVGRGRRRELPRHRHRLRRLRPGRHAGEHRRQRPGRR